MTEQEANERLQRFWSRVPGASDRAPTVAEMWLERERIAEADGLPLPTLQETIWDFASMATPSAWISYSITPSAVLAEIPRKLVLPPAKPLVPMTWNLGWTMSDEDRERATFWGLA
jgi:hypothetical protein